MSLILTDTTDVLSVDSIDQIPAAFRRRVAEKLADPGDIPLDGRFHTFRTPGDEESSRKNGRAGYCCIDPARLVGVFGSYRPGECPATVIEFELPDGQSPSEQERAAMLKRLQEEQARLERDAADRAGKAWDVAGTDVGDHPYPQARGVFDIAKTTGVLRVHNQTLLLAPMFDAGGKLWNLQRIDATGRKRFLDHGRTAGLALWIPTAPTAGQRWWVVEGVAKGLAAHAATGDPVLCAYSANNLLAAIEEHGNGHDLSLCVIAADNDPAGRTVTEQALRRWPMVKAIYPPDGAGDWNDVLVRDGMDRLKELLAGPTFGVEWPDPSPLPGELPPVAAFTYELLPQAFQAWIADIAERMQCPPDYPAVGAMVALAAIVGRKVALKPKRRDDWTVIPNLWGVIVGRPGVLKSPALHEALKPLYRLDQEAALVYATAKAEDDLQREVREQQRQVAKGQIRELLKKGGANAADLAALVVGDTDQGLVRKRYLVNDSSVEKLGELLNQNPNGLLAFRDELLGLLSGLERNGQEGARQFYLEAWNGGGRFTYDRIGRGTIEIEACCLSLLGSIQPDPLQTYLLDAPDDGLMQRFQLAVWPDPPRDWRNVDRWPDKTAKETAWQAFQRLDGLIGLSIGATPADEGGVPGLRFDEDAQAEFDCWRGALEARLRTEELPPSLETVLSKYRSLVPSIALLIHLTDHPEGGPVGLPALIRGCAWAEYLESHAQRVYSAKLTPALMSARALAGKLKTGALPARFGIKDVYRPGWSRLSSSEQAQASVNLLVEHDWLRPLVEPAAITGGRPRTVYIVNPKVRED